MFLKFGPEQIYRADLNSERIVDRAAEIHLRKTFRPGVYEAANDVDAILKNQINFFGARLDKYLPLVASQHFMDFILDQYETATRVHRLFRKNSLTPSEARHWESIERNWRRALKYIAERCTLIADVDPAPKEDEKILMQTTDEVLICAEQLVGYCILSDQTLFVRPNGTRLTINRVSSQNYFDHDIEDYSNVTNFWRRVADDRENRAKFIRDPLPEFDVDKASKYLDPVFNDTFGLSYKSVINFFRSVRESCIPPSEGFPIPFCKKSVVVAGMSDEFKITENAAQTLIAGFSLDHERMNGEGREFWNPKYEYRAYRRGLFEFPHESGEHLTFSPEMYSECLMMLSSGMSFKQIPADWHSPELEKAVNRLSEDAGRWFEQTVQTNLHALGYKGESFNRNVGISPNRVVIPDDVGELDFLGTNEQEGILLLVECKRTQPGAEPKFWRKDLTEFTQRKNNYSEKFRRKANWVFKNHQAILAALKQLNLAPEANLNRFCYCMITMYPNIASYSIDDFPCVSLVEFRLGYQKQGLYPYAYGTSVLESAKS